MASFRDSTGEEFLLQTEGEAYRPMDLAAEFEKCECSGFDDMFPTIDPCVVHGLEYLDHGEICRREHNVVIEGDKVTFSCTLPILNILFQKTVWCEEGALFAKYRIENRNGFDFSYIWAAHMMFKGDKGAYAVSNFPAGAPITILDGTPDENAPHVLPEGGHHYKYYYSEGRSPLRCGVAYPASKAEVWAEFDSEIVKYLGFWINPGDLNDMYTIAVEPCTGLYDTPVAAEEAKASSSIPAHGAVEFTMKLFCRKETANEF